VATIHRERNPSSPVHFRLTRQANSAGLATGDYKSTDVVEGLWSNLCRRLNFLAHDCDDRTHDPALENPTIWRRLWYRRFANNADDVSSSLHCDARDFGVGFDRVGNCRSIFSGSRQCVLFLANLTKIASGGYVPLLLAIAVYGMMWTWHRGTAAIDGTHP